jgi:hypothetical protein
MIGYLFILNNLHQIYCSAILDRRLKVPGFELMKPHTVKGYNGAENSLQKQKHANITGHAESVATQNIKNYRFTIFSVTLYRSLSSKNCPCVYVCSQS